ncbi:MAG: LCP family protein [Elusimicrobiota bacterium]
MDKKYKIPLIVVILPIAGIIFIIVTAFSPVKREVIFNKRINILLLGVSKFDYAHKAEVIQLLSYEPRTGFIDVMAIPRDTMMPVPYEITWKRIQKINEVYSRYRNNSKNAEELFVKFKSKTEELLKDNLEIEYFAQFDYNAFKDFVDCLGGVTVDVKERMVYDDYAQDLHIDISTGTQNLGGEKALHYVRYRDKVRGDIGRQERQHKFVKAVLEELKSPRTLLKIPSLFEAVMDNLDTNLNFPDILGLADEIRNLEFKNMRVQRVPGEPVTRWGKSYWQADGQGLKEVIDVVKNSQLINLPVRKIDRSARLDRSITVEVWNASGDKGMAREITNYLRKRNVDVVRYGNYGVIKEYTEIISRDGKLKPAREVADLIGCQNVSTELDTSRMVNLNIVIGRDFNEIWTGN